uniref:Large ribosomal subunit protein eL34 n=1 Tax=Glossina morsitans morsitans TaxID=37546 RepID=A0A1B0G1B1_GLOMM
MVQRLTLRRRLSYNTKSNTRRIVRTPGGRLVYQYVKKNNTVPKCGQCKEKLKGIRPTRPCERSRLSKRQKTVVHMLLHHKYHDRFPAPGATVSLVKVKYSQLSNQCKISGSLVYACYFHRQIADLFRYFKIATIAESTSLAYIEFLVKEVPRCKREKRENSCYHLFN